MTSFTIQAFESEHHAWAIKRLSGHMGTHLIVSRGVLYDALDYDGFVAIVDGKPRGLLTYRIEGDQCEILTLHSQIEGAGIGVALVEKVKAVAQEAGCKRLWLISTNDNTHAIRWYQKRGFTIAAVHVNALEVSRQLKPQIPATGFDGIPLRDEIEFELELS